MWFARIRELLILERVLRVLIETLGVAIDDLYVQAVSGFVFGQIFHGITIPCYRRTEAARTLKRATTFL